MKLDLIVLVVALLFVLGGIRLGATGSLMKFLSFFGSTFLSLVLFSILQKTDGTQKAVDVICKMLEQKGMTLFADRVAAMAANVLLFLLLYFGSKLLLFFLSVVLEGVFRLPLLKQANRLTGALLGVLEAGILICGILALLQIAGATHLEIYQWIEESVLTKALYTYNPLILFFAGKGGK